MDSNEKPASQENKDKQMNFKDLEPLLQQCLNEKNLQVINQSVTKLLAVGENYGSVMLKLDVTVRKNKTAAEETLHLVAKTPSFPENLLIQWPLIFKKEQFMYAELFPLYRELEREAAVNEDELIDMLPKYIGYRNSLKNTSEVDKDSVLLFENIKVKGFYTVKRCVRKFCKKVTCNFDARYVVYQNVSIGTYVIPVYLKELGLDVHHARKALPLLARYHVLGIVMQQRRPSFAKKAIEQARTLGTDFTQLDPGFAAICQTFVTIPRLQKYLTTFEPSFELIKGGGTWKATPEQPWATITHNDFWTNNILFHKDDSGKVDDVKFVDFQGYIYSSPLKDLFSLFTASIDVPTQTNHLKELIDLYYDSFIATLRRMNCDVSPFTRESFDNELKKQAIIQFPICALAVKFLGSDEIINEEKNHEENLQSVFTAGASDAFIDRLIWVLEIYEKMKWL